MSNEQYLTVSYFAAVLIAVLLASAVSWFLLGPFREVARSRVREGHAALLVRALPLGTILLALTYCLGFSYLVEGCSARTYSKLVSDRQLIEHKSREQVATTVDGLQIATLVWCGVTLVLFLRRRGHSPGEATAGGPWAVSMAPRREGRPSLGADSDQECRPSS